MSTDPFLGVLGPARGNQDLRALASQLAVAERSLARAQAELADAQETQEQLGRSNEELREQLDVAKGVVRRCNEALASMRRQRNRARYVILRAGLPDPLAGVDADAEHHGIWTPKRPYLDGQHCCDPLTGDCYRAESGGVRAGVRPRPGRFWSRCLPGTHCPKPHCALEPGPGEHALETGYAFRQTTYWWDAEWRRIRLDELDPAHLLAVLDWLEEQAGSLFHRELERSVEYVPCPASAYGSEEDWLDDTPLWQALIEEKRRRRLRRPAQGGRRAMNTHRKQQP